jgi:hypothetical protein
MKFSHVSIIAVLFVVLAVAIAGCSSSAPASSSSGGAPSGGAAAAPAGGASSGPITGSDLFGGLNYNWVEYKTTSNAGGQEMTIYMKWTKEGKCTMRFEGAGAEAMAGMPTEFDCSSTGSAEAQNNPTDVGSDVKMVKVGTETVTVPAGTFVADKYTATVEGTTATYWIAGGKPLLKMEGSTPEGTVVTELNGWG